MIDMHIHSLYSDGTDLAIDIIKKAIQLHIDVISITDHNNCLAYQELDSYCFNNPSVLRVITGCEFTTSFDGQIIEVLGYGFDHKEIQDYFNQQMDFLLNDSIIRNLIVEKIHKLSLIFDYTQVRKLKFSHERIECPFYEELRHHPQNMKIIDENIWDTFGDFYRKGVMNPQSRLYLNYANYYPSLSDINTLVHTSGGCTFLAHPFQYRLPNIKTLLNRIFAKSQLDGVECYHTACTDQQRDYLLDFAVKSNLLISGGSDYHGQNKTQHELGCGCGNLIISSDILNRWPVSFYLR